jgi:hypothetical protein
MNATPVFSFAITYDRDSVKASARTLFFIQQKLMLRFSLGTLVFTILTAAGISWYIHFYWMFWLPLVFLFLQLLLVPFGVWALFRRLDRTMTGTSAQIQFSDASLSIASESGSHQLPWKNFKFTRRDSKNLLLCFVRPGAIIIPMETAPAEALEFAEARVLEANAPV